MIFENTAVLFLLFIRSMPFLLGRWEMSYCLPREIRNVDSFFCGLWVWSLAIWLSSTSWCAIKERIRERKAGLLLLLLLFCIEFCLVFCILFGIVLSGEGQRSESLTFWKVGEFLREEGAEGWPPFRVVDTSHQNTEPRQGHSSSVTSVWVSGRAVHQGLSYGGPQLKWAVRTWILPVERSSFARRWVWWASQLWARSVLPYFLGMP